jgi:UrcA family protein
MLMNAKRTDSVQRRLSRLFAGISGILITAAMAVAPQAHAQDTETRSWVVGHADLDLSRDRDVRRLELRIRLAARRLCTPNGIAEIYVRKELRRCANEAVSDALRQMNQRVARHRLNDRALDRQEISMR